MHKSLKLTFGTLTALSLTMAPALAQHQGHEMRQEIRRDIHSEGMNPAQHGAAMEAMMKYALMASQRSLDMMSLGNSLMEGALQKKDAKGMLTGAELAFKGHALHRHSMMGMEQLNAGLKEHLMHAKVGDLQLSEAQMNQLSAGMASLKKEIDAAMTACHQEMAKMAKNGAALMDQGNELMLKGKNDKNPELMLSGNELLMAGMKLQMSLHGNHGQRRIEKRVIRLRGDSLEMNLGGMDQGMMEEGLLLEH